MLDQGKQNEESGDARMSAGASVWNEDGILRLQHERVRGQHHCDSSSPMSGSPAATAPNELKRQRVESPARNEPRRAADGVCGSDNGYHARTGQGRLPRTSVPFFLIRRLFDQEPGRTVLEPNRCSMRGTNMSAEDLSVIADHWLQRWQEVMLRRALEAPAQAAGR